MRKHAIAPRRGLPRVVLTLTALEMAGLALSAFFWLVMRRDLLFTYRGVPMPAATAVALSAWFVPAASGAGALLTIVAWIPSLRTMTHTYFAATALVCTVFGLAFAIWVSYAPAFEQLGP